MDTKKRGLMSWITASYAGSSVSGSIPFETVIKNISPEEEKEIVQFFQSMVETQPEENEKTAAATAIEVEQQSE